MKIWLIWNYTNEGTKIPSWPDTGRWGLKWKNPDNLIRYDEAVKSRDKNKADGIGLVIPKGYCLIDIDDVSLDNPSLLELILYIDSYSETSPSGSGIHVLVKHNLINIKNIPAFKTKTGISIEVKPNTYTTYTGNIFHDVQIKDATDLLRETYTKIEHEKDKSTGGKVCCPARAGPVTNPSVYFNAALKDECDKVRHAVKGHRTNILFGAAAQLGRFKDNIDLVWFGLRNAARQCGLPDEKIRRTIKDGFAYS